MLGATAVIAATALLLTGCGASSKATAQAKSPAALRVSTGYIPQPLLTDLAAAYVTVVNSGGSAAQLTSVTSPLAAHVTLHTTVHNAMRQVTSLPVPARGTLALGNGGDHMMLENLTHKPKVGDTVVLQLHFAHATPATITITVPVRPTTYLPKG